MWLSSRLHLFRACGFGTSTAAAVRRRLWGGSGPPSPRALRRPLLGGIRPNCLPFPRNGAPFASPSFYLPHGARPPRELRWHAFSTSANAVPADAPKKDIDDQIADTQILRNLVKYLMLNDSPDFRFRLVLSLGLLVGAKVINVQVPFLFKLAVDWLAALAGTEASLASFTDANATMLALFASPAAVLIGYGIARSGASACTELRNALFSKVTLRATRSVCRMAFLHLHELDLRYHLSRQTGALNRIIDRGSRAINSILTIMVFNIVPTILEISMVSSILAYKFGSTFAWLTSASVATYIAFTLVVTQWRTKFRTAMNEADNASSTVAVDSLLNYETVKYFKNERFEVEKYDKYLKQYEDAALKTQSSLAYLDFGQNVILSSALSAAMVLSSYGVMSGALTVGDLVILYVNHLCFVSSNITFLSVILLKGLAVPWMLWKHRNSCVFDRTQPSVRDLVQEIFDEAHLWARAGAKGIRVVLPTTWDVH